MRDIGSISLPVSRDCVYITVYNTRSFPNAVLFSVCPNNRDCHASNNKDMIVRKILKSTVHKPFTCNCDSMIFYMYFFVLLFSYISFH
jgi:hypothetical protein